RLSCGEHMLCLQEGRAGKVRRVETGPPLKAPRPRQPDCCRSLRQNGFAPDQGVEPAMPLVHLGSGGVVCTHHRASNSESVEWIERPGAIQQAPILVSGPISKPRQTRNTE